MKKASLFLAGLALAAGAAWAQVDIKWNLDHATVPLMGAIDAHLKITNRTGEEMSLGPGGNTGLSFLVDDGNGGIVMPNGGELVKYPVRIANGGTGVVTVDLSDGYSLLRAQPYAVSPVLDLGGGERFAGPRKTLDVQPGLEIARLETGLASRGTDREATLRQVHRDRSDVVFFRLDAPSASRCLGVYELGTLIRFAPPRLAVDGEGNWHVLHQSAPDRFVHSVFGPDGAPASRDLYTAQAGHIRLDVGDDGVAEVVGGNKFEASPDAPGTLVAPALAPSVPFQTLEDAGGSSAGSKERSSWWR